MGIAEAVVVIIVLEETRFAIFFRGEFLFFVFFTDTSKLLKISSINLLPDNNYSRLTRTVEFLKHLVTCP